MLSTLYRVPSALEIVAVSDVHLGRRGSFVNPEPRMLLIDQNRITLETIGLPGGHRISQPMRKEKQMLTPSDWKEINLGRAGTSLLTEQEIDEIATWLNRKIGLPFVNERKEQIVLAKIVKRVDEFLYGSLPNEYYELIRMLDDGITLQEAEIIKKRLTALANRHIDIPMVSEAREGKILRAIIGLIVDAMVRNASLETKLREPFTSLVDNQSAVVDRAVPSLVG